MPVALKTLPYFLGSYLAAAEGDTAAAVLAFARSEGGPRLEDLRRDIEAVMAGDLNVEDVNRANGLVRKHSEMCGMHPFEFLQHLHHHVQLAGPAAPLTRPLDVFISHSEQDKPWATRIGWHLLEAGFRVSARTWDTEMVPLQEHIRMGVQSAAAVVIVASRRWCESPWTRPETASLLQESMASEQTLVVLALTERIVAPQLFEGLLTVDLTEDWERGARQLLASLEGYRSTRLLKTHLPMSPDDFPTAESRLDEFFTAVQRELAALGWTQGEAFKDVIVGPTELTRELLSKDEILRTVETCRVRLRNWGGAPFPYDLYPDTVMKRLADGIQVYDTRPWPFRAWSFRYWRFTHAGQFAHRTDIEEDFMLDMGGRDAAPLRFLSLEWLLKDLCMPLMFAQRLCGALSCKSPLIVKFHWSGLKDRQLLLLNRSRVPMRRKYESREDSFVKDVLVDQNTVLQDVVEMLLEELMVQFHWEQYPRETLSQEVQQLLLGTFPW